MKRFGVLALAALTLIAGAQAGLLSIAGGRGAEPTAPGADPAWFEALTSMTYSTPATNRIVDVADPLGTSGQPNQGNNGSASIIQAESGFGYDAALGMLFSLANGGHADYYGNEVYGLCVTCNPLTWQRLKNATSNPSPGTPPAGNPWSSHNYWDVAGYNGIWVRGATNSAGDNGFSDQSRGWLFNYAARTWHDLGSVSPIQGVSYAATAYDPEDANFIFVSGTSSPSLKRYSVNGNGLSFVDQLSSGNNQLFYRTMLAVDTTHHILLARRSGGSPSPGQQFFSISLDNIAGGWQSFNATGVTFPEKTTLIWHEPSNGFLTWDPSNDILKMSMTIDGSNRYSAGVITAHDVLGTAPTDQTGQGGMLSKVHLVEMPSGEHAMIIVPQWAGTKDTWAVRIPGAVGADDWTTRSTATGVTFANRLQTQADQDNWVHPNGEESHVSIDTSTKVSGAAASFKFTRLNSDTTGSGSVAVPIGTFGQGSTVWVSYRHYAEHAYSYQPWPFSGSGGSHKLSIFSSYPSSNTANEVVIQTNYTANSITGYWQDGVSSSIQPDVSASTACSGSDFRWQPSVDHGASPLTGTNPDTGSAWSSCEQDRARYGGLFAAKSLAQFRRGYGDPLSGAIREVPDEWITYTFRLVIGTWGSFNSRWTLWAARDGQPYSLVHDKQNIRLGSAPDYTTLWLLPYVSDGQTGGRKVVSRTSNITGAEILAVGLQTPTGDGTLEYNATTGRFRWLGNGESFGTARGFSAANGILTINVTSGGASDSYVILRVTPASLPSSGTTTDTVTISDGRPDASTYYNDLIISTQAINAPGGYAPP